MPRPPPIQCARSETELLWNVEPVSDLLGVIQENYEISLFYEF